MGNKPVKNENKKNLETYSQGKDTLKYLKINPPKLPNIYNHDYDLKNVDTMSKNETYGKITKGTIPVVFFGHLMSENKIDSIISQKFIWWHEILRDIFTDISRFFKCFIIKIAFSWHKCYNKKGENNVWYRRRT